MGQHVGTSSRRSSPKNWKSSGTTSGLDTPQESAENFAVYGLAYTVNSGSVTTSSIAVACRPRAAWRSSRQRESSCGRTSLIAMPRIAASSTGCRGAPSPTAGSCRRRRSTGSSRIRTTSRRCRSAGGQYKVIGKSIPALDIPAKTTGEASTASTFSCPTWSTGVGDSAHPLRVQGARHRRSAARKIPGFVKAVKIDDSTASVPGGRRAGREVPGRGESSDGAQGRVDAGPYATLGSADLLASTRSSRRKRGERSVGAEGDVDQALGQSERVLEMEYTTDMVCHRPWSPSTPPCGGQRRVHVYVGTQSTSFARMTLTVPREDPKERSPRT